MPVTLKLSKRFYDTFGQETTDELVDALNAVDQSYRSEFRELFDANFGRLEARIGELGAELRAEMAGLRSDMVGLRGEIKQHESRTDAKLEAMKSELLKWLFLFWVGTIGIVLVIVRL